MPGIIAIFRREITSYFITPLAYVFIVIFLVMNGIFTFYAGDFLERNQADLRGFFHFHPWLYLVFIPAIAMRLWAEEKKSGTIELLMTLPISTWDAVWGKFLAAWAFIGIALALTFPIWLTVAYLGKPDHGLILAGYIGSFLMAGGYLAIGSALSALSKSQVIAFVLGVTVSFIFTVTGFPMVLDGLINILPLILLETIASFSFLSRFNGISNGLIELRDLLYFAGLILLWLYINVAAIEAKKAE